MRIFQKEKTMYKIVLLLSVACIAVMAADFSITIDAEKDPWYNTLTGPENGWIYIPHQANNDSGGWAKHDDDYDLSANFWCAWDQNYFYFYEEVWDDYLCGSTGTPWENDCLEIKFDPDPLLGPPQKGSGVFAIVFTAFDSTDTDGPLSGVANMRTLGNEDIADYVYVPNEDYARKITTLGYTLEGRIPWDHIYYPNDQRGPVVPRIGNIFGMALMNEENDGTGGLYGAIEWASHMVDAVWNNVNYHGTVTFLEEHRLSLSTKNAITGIDTNSIDFRPKNVRVIETAHHPTSLELKQNYPNPFNASTRLSFSLPRESRARLVVYDLCGRIVSVLADGMQAAGSHSLVFEAEGLPTGVYLYRLETEEQTLTKKMVLTK